MSEAEADSPIEAITQRQQIRMELRRRVRMARASLGLSQAEFGERCGLGRNAISSIEKGGRSVAAYEIAAMAEVTGFPVEWFYGATRPKLNGKVPTSVRDHLKSVTTDGSHRKTEPHARQLPLTVPVASPRT